MRLLPSLFLISIFLIGCSAPSGLIGDYQDKPVVHMTSASYDKVWDKVIDHFAIEGIPIQVIEKNSGLIVSQVMDFTNSYTIESNKVEPNFDAFVIVNEVKQLGAVLRPLEITGTWNVRVKDLGNKTSINVNINNLRASGEKGNVLDARSTIPFTFEVKSTGFFEKQIAQLFAGQESFEAKSNSASSVVKNSNPERAKSEQVVSQQAKSDDVAPQKYAQATQNDLRIEELQSKIIAHQKSYSEISAQYEDSQSQVKSQQIQISALEKEVSLLNSQLISAKNTGKTDESKVIQDLREELRQLKIDNAALNVKLAASYAAGSLTAAPTTVNTVSQPVTVSYPSSPRSQPVNSSPGPKYLIQIAAAAKPMSFPELSDLGTIVTEPVPGKSLVRYQLGTFYDRSSANDVLSSVKGRGYGDAYVVSR